MYIFFGKSIYLKWPVTLHLSYTVKVQGKYMFPDWPVIFCYLCEALPDKLQELSLSVKLIVLFVSKWRFLLSSKAFFPSTPFASRQIAQITCPCSQKLREIRLERESAFYIWSICIRRSANSLVGGAWACPLWVRLRWTLMRDYESQHAVGAHRQQMTLNGSCNTNATLHHPTHSP